jgi:hypothetical protein
MMTSGNLLEAASEERERLVRRLPKHVAVYIPLKDKHSA